MRSVRKSRGRNKGNDFLGVLFFRIFVFMHIWGKGRKMKHELKCGRSDSNYRADTQKINEDRSNFFGRSNSDQFFSDIYIYHTGNHQCSI